MNVVISIYIDGKCIREQVMKLDAVVHVDLLGIEVSKNALMPTDLMVIVSKVGEHNTTLRSL